MAGVPSVIPMPVCPYSIFMFLLFVLLHCILVCQLFIVIAVVSCSTFSPARPPIHNTARLWYVHEHPVLFSAIHSLVTPLNSIIFGDFLLRPQWLCMTAHILTAMSVFLAIVIVCKSLPDLHLSRLRVLWMVLSVSNTAINTQAVLCV